MNSHKCVIFNLELMYLNMDYSRDFFSFSPTALWYSRDRCLSLLIIGKFAAGGLHNSCMIFF